MIRKTVLLLLLVCSGLSAQEPVGGPISDIIEKRLEERIDRQLQALEGIEQRIESRQASRLSEIVSSIRELKEDREGAFAALKEFRNDRENMLGLFKTMASRFSEMSERWTPLQNLVDRLTGLVWKLFWFVCVLGGCVLLILLVGLFLYSRLKGFVSNEIGGLVKKIAPVLFLLSPSFAFAQIRCEQMQGPTPIYRVHRPQYSTGCGSTGHYSRPQAIYHAPIVHQPVRTIIAPAVQPVVRVVEPVVSPVVNAVRSVSGCENGQCGRTPTYTPRLLQTR